MKIFFLIAGLLCLAGNCVAQHLLQIDDGHGNYLLLAPPLSLSGSRTLSLPLPPLTPMAAGFIGTGTATGQIPIWDNTQLAWIAVNSNAVLNAMLPSQAGNNGKVLFTDGTNTGWTAISPVGAVSVFGRTGIVTAQTGDYNFSQISGAATAPQLPNLQAMNGLLDLAHGGTGQITTNAALNVFLPTQTGNANKILQTDGTNSSWAFIPSAPVLSVFGRTGIIIAANNDYSFSQVAGSATASQLPNLQNMNGLLDIAHGGTGQTTANAALNVLLPTQSGNANKVLQTDGTNTSWIIISSAPVSSVFGRTGVITGANNDYSFSQISGAATASQLPNLQAMNGLLDVTHGGTGQITANAALNAMLPTQTGNANKVLQTDGTNTNWIGLINPPVTSVFGRTGVIISATGDYNFSQISGSAIANQLPNLQSMNGLLDLAHGGTGQITSNASLNALLPTQTGNANKVLQSDGANTGWVLIPSSPISSVFGRTGVVVAVTNDYSFSQISGSATALQLPNLQNMNGVLDIAHGGSGQITANASLNALLPSQAGNANKVLQTDGTNTTWIGLIGPPVSSVFGRTGAVTSATGDYSFSQISGSATASQLPNLQAMDGVLDLAHGGTGQITANAALNALLPNQTGNANKVLQTDGTNTTWISLISSPVSSVFGRTGVITSASGDYSFSQISGSAIAAQLPNLQTMNGLLDIAHGGTGQTTPNAALNAMLPTQTGNANKVLQTDGTNTSWIIIPSAPVLSVFGRTGIIIAANNDYNFSQVAGSATASQLPSLQNLNGLLDIAHGGSGQTTANAALNVLLPTQSGNANKVLQTDGTNTSWVAGGGAVTSVFGRTGVVVAGTNDYSFSQISGSATASQLPNLQSMNGLLDIAHGGTGQITANAALNTLLPTQTGNANKILQTDGTNASWISPISPLVSSVFGRTGAITSATGDYSFSQISGSATAGQLPNLQNMNGLLDIAHGGTGQITANASLNALLPSQAGNVNKVLQTDGTNTTWIGLIGPPVSSVFGRTGIITSATGDYNFSQISGSAIANQLPNLENMNGLLDIAHGGTGQITANASLNVLLPTQTGNANKVLQTDGTNANWISPISSPVISVFGRTGIIISATGDYSFSQISGSATASQLPNLQAMNGLLDIAHGGTGQITANAALNAFLPTQTGNANKILQTDGTNTTWISPISSPVTSVFGRTGAITSATNDYSFSQISGSATASQLPNLQAMNGLLDIAHGGTGQISANASLNALLPTQSGNANKVLQTDGTNTAWVTIASAPVSSVFGRTGVVVATNNDYSFSQISGSATASQLPNLQNMNGLLDIIHGGTGQITANGALNALLPSQTGNGTKYLQTDGTNTSWVSVAGGGSVTGSGTSTQVAFWSSTSALSSSTNLYWDNTNFRLSIGAGSSPIAALDITSSGKTINSISSTTTDENFAVFGKVNGSSTNQIIGVWGSASNTATTNTGSIAVLGTGNGNTIVGQTNVALQLNDGEFAMGRTSQAPGTGTVVEAATAGVAYSQEGPSGVIEIDFKGAADLTLASNVFENFVSGITINNRYVTTSSIILVEVLSQSEGSTNQSGTTFATKNVTFSTAVRNRAAGSFTLSIDILNATGGNIVVDGGAASSDKDKIRIGYTVINPGK